MKGTWSNQFLSQKSWHPLNKKNQLKLAAAERQHELEERRKEERALELNEENERLRQASRLAGGNAESRKLAESKVALSFMYGKPPGLSEAEAKGHNPSNVDSGSTRPRDRRENEGNKAGNMGINRAKQLAEKKVVHIWERDFGNAASAVHPEEASPSMRAGSKYESKYELRHEYGGDRSPIRGGCLPTDENQQLVMSSSSSEGGDEETCQETERKKSQSGKKRKHRSDKQQHHNHHNAHKNEKERQRQRKRKRRRDRERDRERGKGRE